jgi:excisionase family DNA binding protein
MITNETEYTTVAEAAKILRVSVPTVWRWIDSGQLRAHRVGRRNIRIKKQDLATVIRPARNNDMKEQLTQQDLLIIHLGRRPVDVDNLLGTLRKGQEAILARRRGKRFRSSVPLIREGRDERSAAL